MRRTPTRRWSHALFSGTVIAFGGSALGQAQPKATLPDQTIAAKVDRQAFRTINLADSQEDARQNEAMECHLANYFLLYRGENGLVQARSSAPGVYGIADTGFGMDVWAILATDKNIKPEERWLTTEQAARYINQALDFMEKTNPKKNRGWYYHFVGNDGTPRLNSEVSTIDTAIFYEGAKQAAKRLGNATLLQRIKDQVSRIDKTWMIANSVSGKRISHGLYWEGDKPIFLSYEWDHSSEGIIIYRWLGIPNDFHFENFDLSLFVYYYPMCFLPQAEFKPLLIKAIHRQLDLYGHTGVTITDTEAGYSPQSAAHISPLTMWIISPFYSPAKEKIKQLKVPPWTHSYNLKTGWTSPDRVGIDEGAAFLIRHPLPENAIPDQASSQVADSKSATKR